MSLHSTMNSTLTRVQAFVVVAMMILLAFGGVALGTLGKISDRPIAAVQAHGIETSWHSDMGIHRIWSITSLERGVTPWLEDHVAAAKEAERLMPPTDR